MKPNQSIFLTCFLLIAATLFFVTCGDDKGTEPEEPEISAPVSVPVLTTTAVSAITQITAEGGGNITSDGGAAVTARGVCWCTNATPTTSDSKTTDGSGTGSFTSAITSLTAGTNYYVRAYATNSAGTGYGSAQPFTTATSLGTVTDIDGNVYQTVTIGGQVWMAENLKVTHYRDGTPIPNITGSNEWAHPLYKGFYCDYYNNVNNVATYGRLYNFYAVASHRGIAPAGWHVPSDGEWKRLEMYLGLSQAEADTTGYRGTDEGGKLKEAGTTHWDSPNAGATNESGFTALPGGARYWDGLFGSLGSEAIFWSSTSLGLGEPAWLRGLSCERTNIIRNSQDKRVGFSVRCVRD